MYLACNNNIFVGLWSNCRHKTGCTVGDRTNAITKTIGGYACSPKWASLNNQRSKKGRCRLGER